MSRPYLLKNLKILPLMVHLVLHNSIALVMCHLQKLAEQFGRTDILLVNKNV